MQNQPIRTNGIKCLDIISWHILRINPDAGFAGGPHVLNRSHDPRLLKEDQAAQFRRCGSRVTVKQADIKLLKSPGKPGERGTLGGIKRYWSKVELIHNITLTKSQDEAGILLDYPLSWFAWDIQWNCLYHKNTQGQQDFVSLAAADLNAKIPGWGVAPSMINPLATQVLAGPAINHPNAVQVIAIEFLYDEYINSVTPTQNL